MIGYGLTDVETEGYSCTDSRINPDGIVCKYYDYDNVDVYLAFVKEQIAKDEGIPILERKRVGFLDRWIIKTQVETGKADRSDFEPGSAVVWRGEYGMPNVLCVRPLLCRDWYRYADTLDWTEETEFSPGGGMQGNWVKLLKDGIWPFSGLYMDTQTGERLPLDWSMEWARFTHYPTEWGASDEGTRTLIRMKIAEKLGMTLEEAEIRIAPHVPEEIQTLCEWGQAFTDPAVVFQLRPMMYVYWG